MRALDYAGITVDVGPAKRNSTIMRFSTITIVKIHFKVFAVKNGYLINNIDGISHYNIYISKVSITLCKRPNI